MHIIALASMLAFLAVWIIFRRPGTFTPLDFFVAFLMTQFGPHILLNQGNFELSKLTNSSTPALYFIGIAIGYISLSLGILTGSFLLPRTIVSKYDATQFSSSKGEYRRGFTVSLICVGFYCLIFLLADGPGLPRLSTIIRFLLGSSDYSYNDIRRVLFVDTLYENLAARTRFSITPILACLLISCAVASEVSYRLWLPAVGALYVICAAQLSKFPFVYYMCLVLLTLMLVRSKNFVNPFTPRTIAIALATIFLSFIALYGLYNIQYSDALSAGLLVKDDIIDLLLYRPFFAVSDALYLWFGYFPDQHSFLGLANVSLLTSIADLEEIDPTTAVPMAYLGNSLTTMQTGFFGSGYAAYGFPGIGIHALVAGLVVWVISEIPFHLKNGVLRTTLLVVLGLNTYFLTTRQLHTALISGGVLLTPFVVLSIAGILRFRRSHGKNKSQFALQNSDAIPVSIDKESNSSAGTPSTGA